ncbi:MAG: class I SAM-dependent DNA methyltransferase, partial [Ilumatobacteraceae bacterium]|nr:class I SAM-dependent DNA methyltransferase [Ilumatobacteraceae bacterium]
VDGYSLLLKPDQIDLLIAAAKADWRSVEPAIFGALLERTLHPTERHALGAHYTPRAYIERLVLPTVMEPLRAEWANAQAAALVLAHEAAELTGRAMTDKLTEARAEVKKFHHRLCSLRVLDPACGSANFLYVTLEHLKRLEGEVINQLLALGETQDRLGFEGETVTVQQLRGIELNPRAAAVAELVLWIGFLQWHIRTQGNTAVAEPVVHDFENIECRDAVLAWDAQEPAYDDHGQLLTRWDGVTFKTHPVTVALVPEESAQVPQWKYRNARAAQWPQADFIVGNPPFIGKLKVREALGDGYVEALRSAWSQVPDSADFVMYWWAKAAALVAEGSALRMGLITTNSLRQTFNRRVVQAALDEPSALALTFAIADHPWVDSANGAAVRIAMTVATKSDAGRHTADDLADCQVGHLLTVTSEETGDYGEVDVTLVEQTGVIHADLSVGIDVSQAVALKANSELSNIGVIPHGEGFIVSQQEALDLAKGLPTGLRERLLREYRNGRDLTGTIRYVVAIDTFGFDESTLQHDAPAIWQWLHIRVKPDRDQNPRRSRRENWWRYGEDHPRVRGAIAGLPRFIVTVVTSKHRVFQFLDKSILPDQTLVVFGLNDAFHLGVLSSRLHEIWALATGSRLGVGNDPRYNKTRCFETFPFPTDATGLTPNLRQTIASIAERIDTHRKQVLSASGASKEVTLTGLYNVIQALKEGRPLTVKEKSIHSQGLVSVLKELHDELDAAVLAAYGWSDLNGATHSPELLGRLLSLNAQRAADEEQGIICWLRPDFQNPLSKQELPTQVQQGLEVDLPVINQSEIDSKIPIPWPATLPEQISTLAQELTQAHTALTLPQIDMRFKGRGKKNLPVLLQTLEALGRAQRQDINGVVTWRA